MVRATKSIHPRFVVVSPKGIRTTWQNSTNDFSEKVQSRESFDRMFRIVGRIVYVVTIPTDVADETPQKLRIVPEGFRLAEDSPDNDQG